MMKERYRPRNIFISESTAYRRLMEAGICQRGITPKFYGTIEKLDPTQCLPQLKAFVDDGGPASAIFLEYIPGICPIHWTNYNAKRMQNFARGLEDIHKAMVLHADLNPRNMMAVDGDPERALWIDFDRADTYEYDTELTEHQKEWMGIERDIVTEMDAYMVS
jgi:hypothetical protein